MDVCSILNIEHEILCFIAYPYFQTILLYQCDMRILMGYKAHTPSSFFSSQSYKMSMVGYGMDLWVSGCIDRVPLIPDQRIEGMLIVIMQVLLVIIEIRYYGCWDCNEIFLALHIL